MSLNCFLYKNKIGVENMIYAKVMVREMIKELGFKQVAKNIGVSETSVRNWINKDTNISIYSLDLIEDAHELYKKNKMNKYRS